MSKARYNNNDLHNLARHAYVKWIDRSDFHCHVKVIFDVKVIFYELRSPRYDLWISTIPYPPVSLPVVEGALSQHTTRLATSGVERDVAPAYEERAALATADQERRAHLHQRCALPLA